MKQTGYTVLALLAIHARMLTTTPRGSLRILTGPRPVCVSDLHLCDSQHDGCIYGEPVTSVYLRLKSARVSQTSSYLVQHHHIIITYLNISYIISSHHTSSHTRSHYLTHGHIVLRSCPIDPTGGYASTDPKKTGARLDRQIKIGKTAQGTSRRQCHLNTNPS